METRWIILVVLFIVRTAIGLQFQSVASVSPFLIEDLGIDYTRLGLLIGLYQLPGFVLALPGGLLGRRFGDKLVVMTGLVLMTIGGLIMGIYDSYTLSVVGRLMSGVGAILLNVLLTKMIADWFAGKEIITAMAVLMSSWPFGISLGLLSLGRLATLISWQFVMYLTAAACLIALILVATFYRIPPITNEKQATESTKFKLSLQEIWLVLLASLIWTLFNVSFIALPSFAPDLFISIGYTVPVAGSLVSIVTWIVIPSIQIGGYISEKLERPNIILVASLSGIGLGMFLLPFWPYPVVLFILLGFIFGPPVGIMMALPTEVLHPENRAVGIGLFWTFYYGGMSVLTTLTGLSRDLTQSPAAPLLFGGMLPIAAIIIFAVFRMFKSRVNLIALESNEI